MTSANSQQRLVEVSVIIPTRNRLAFLKEAVASVLAQDYRDREVVVVDDMSEDGTWEWLSSLQHPGVRVLRMERHGERSAARNLGLDHAQGNYVLFLDDDDLLAPGALSYLQRNAEKCPEALAVVGARISFDDRGNWYRPTHPRWTVKGRAWRDVLFGCIPLQGQTIMRKSELLAAGAWNEGWSVAEDHELWLRLTASNREVVICPRVVRKMRIHPGQTPLVGRFRDYVNLRRDFVLRLPSELQSSGRRIFRAQRMTSIAGKYEARGRYLNAASFYLQATVRAPELLTSPQPAMVLLGGLFRATVGIVLGKGLLTAAQKVKGLARASLKPRLVARPELAGHE
jgi:glycosyltransferase involved in cell wall biosynthesis